MKEFVYQNIIGKDGLPVKEWVTDEEFDRRTSEIEQIGNVLREFAKISSKQTQDYLDKHKKL